MLDEHYAGLINIADYWVVGDTRTESITAIPSGTTDESQSAQDIELVIIGFNHDDKADGSGKAAITVQTKNQLGSVGRINTKYNTESYSLWSTSPRRTWCNNNFFGALSSGISSLIKLVTKKSNRFCNSPYDDKTSYRTQTTTTDSVFLLSEWEVFGKQNTDSLSYGSLSSDGVQYEYMTIESNRYKSGPANYWWLRTSNVSSTYHSQFAIVTPSCTMGIWDCAEAIGIAPAFCL